MFFLNFISFVKINPDLPQVHTMKGWYESEGKSAEITSLTQVGARGAGGMGGDMGSNIKLISDVKRENLGMNNADGKPEYYSAQAYVVKFKKEKALYKACSKVNDGIPCNKKVLIFFFYTKWESHATST